MRISPKHGFVYISTPKAGTHSIYRILGEHFGDGLIENGFHETCVPEVYQDLPRWTAVRNPFSRAVSLWWSACRLHPEDSYGARAGCGSVDDFLQFAWWLADLQQASRNREPLFRSQSDWLDPVQPIRAFHLEQLGEELLVMPWWSENITLPQLNTTTEKIQAQVQAEGSPIYRPSWRELCRGEDVREAILKWAGRDFEAFGYSTQVDS